MDRDAALMVIHPGRMDNAGEHCAGRVSDLLVERFQIVGLQTAATEDSAEGCKMLGATGRAGEHHDRVDPRQFPRPALNSHPGQEALQDEAPLTVCDEHYVGLARKDSGVLGCERLRDLVVVRDPRTGKVWGSNTRSWR